MNGIKNAKSQGPMPVTSACSKINITPKTFGKNASIPARFSQNITSKPCQFSVVINTLPSALCALRSALCASLPRPSPNPKTKKSSMVKNHTAFRLHIIIKSSPHPQITPIFTDYS